MLMFAQCLLEIPADANIQLKITAVELAGRMGTWAATTAHKNELVNALYGFILTMLQTPGHDGVMIRPLGIEAVAGLCENVECRKQLGDTVPTMMKVAQALGGLLTQKQQIALVKSATQIVMAQPPPQLVAGVQLIWQMVKEALDNALQACTMANPAPSVKEPNIGLAMPAAEVEAKQKFEAVDDVLRIISRGFFTPLKGIGKQARWESLQEEGQTAIASMGTEFRRALSQVVAFGCFPADDIARRFAPFSEKLTESVNVCLVRLFRAFDQQALPFLQETIEEQLAIFERHRHSSCAYLIGKLLDLYVNQLIGFHRESAREHLWGTLGAAASYLLFMLTYVLY